MNIIYENTDNIITSFKVDEQGKRSAIVKKILLNAPMLNCVDYNSNYFAWLAHTRFSNDTFLNIVRVPVRNYLSRTDLVNEINQSYVNSLLHLLTEKYPIQWPQNNDNMRYGEVYRYNTDNPFHEMIDQFIGYNSVGTDSIDYSTQFLTMHVSGDGYAITIEDNNKLIVSFGDKLINYDTNVHDGNGKYSIKITCDNWVYDNEATIVDNIAGVNTTFTATLYSSDNSYPEDIVWKNYANSAISYQSEGRVYRFTPNSDTEGNLKTEYINAFVAAIDKSTLEVLAYVNFSYQTQPTADQIYLALDYEMEITNRDDGRLSLNVLANNEFYVKAKGDTNLDAGVESITFAKQMDDAGGFLNFMRISKNHFRISSEYMDWGSETYNMIIRFYGSANTLIIPVVFNESDEPNKTKPPPVAGQSNEPFNEIVPRNGAVPTSIALSSSDDIQTNFFDKLAGGVVTTVLMDLPWMYLIGKNSGTGGGSIVLKIYLHLSTYNIFTTSSSILVDGKYAVTNSNGKFSVVMTTSTVDTVARANLHLMELEDNSLKFIQPLQPVNIINQIVEPLRKRNEEYVCFDIVTKKYYEQMFWSSFNYTRHNTMDYLNVPDLTFTISSSTVDTSPVILGNYFRQYRVKTLPSTMTLKDTWTMYHRKEFLKNIHVKVCVTYLPNIDRMINSLTTTSLIQSTTIYEGEISIDRLEEIDIDKSILLVDGVAYVYLFSTTHKWCMNGKNNVMEIYVN